VTRPHVEVDDHGCRAADTELVRLQRVWLPVVALAVADRISGSVTGRDQISRPPASSPAAGTGSCDRWLTRSGPSVSWPSTSAAYPDQSCPARWSTSTGGIRVLVVRAERTSATEECRMNVEHILASKGRDVKTIKPDASVEEALRRLRAERIGSLVVSETGTDLAGIISDRDILDAIADRGTEVLRARASSVMTAKVFTCSRDDRVSAIMALMTNRRIRHVPVVEQDGRLCGMISLGDVVKQRLDEIESEAEALREYVTSAM
jgi:CBS domain-containing protein